MTSKTGGFSSVPTLLSALWVALGTRGTYEIIDVRYPRVQLRLFPAQPYVVATLANPDLRVVFHAVSDASMRPPVPSEGKMRIASPTPQPDGRPRGIVSQLTCTTSDVVELTIQLERNVRAAEIRGASFQFEFTNLQLEPRVLIPR